MYKIEVTRKISKRQKATLDKMPINQRAPYLATFLGGKNTRLSISKPKAPTFDKNAFGRVYNTKGEFIKSFLERNRHLYNTSSSKRPTTEHDDYIGVEIECFLPVSKFDSNGGDCQCECNDYCGGNDYDEETGESGDCNGDCRSDCYCDSDYIASVQKFFRSRMVKNICVDGDGSLDSDWDDYFGVEIKVLTRLGDDSNLQKVCSILRELKARVNKSCGLHVHLDARKFKDNRQTCDILAARFSSALPFITKMLPASRMNNTYCRQSVSFRERYSMINMTALDCHGTIEVRAHSGTTDYIKIINWARLMSAIMKSESIQGLPETADIGTFFAVTSVNDDIQMYVKERISKFNPDYLLSQSTMLVSESVKEESGEAA